MFKKKNLYGLVIAMGISTAFLPAQKVGDPAPDFSYQNLSGDTIVLSDYKGKVVFLFLFGNGCPSCRSIGYETETQVEQVYGERDDFQALGLDTWNSTSSVTTVTAFKSGTKITYPLLIMAGDIEQKYSTTYDRVLVIDKEGILRHKGATVVSNDLGNAISTIEGLYSTTDVEDLEGGEGFPGIQIFPNPVSDNAKIHFGLKKEAMVNIRILNLAGQEIRNFGQEMYPAGDHKRIIPAGDLHSGIYILRTEISGRIYTNKMVVN